MTIINHECYISLEIAKLLKEAGFDWEIKTFYFNNELGETMLGDVKNHNFSNQFISAPTLAVVQQWLREVKNVDVFAYRNEPKDKFESIVSVNKKWSTTGMCINTYEEALETAIKKALEMILEKGE